jgi:hypothetical protein
MPADEVLPLKKAGENPLSLPEVAMKAVSSPEASMIRAPGP